MLELHALPATDVLSAFAERKLSPVEYLEALIQRADQIEPLVNAFGDTYYAEALDAARLAEIVYSSRSGEPRPLEGLPVAVKDEAAIAGERTTQGSLILKDHVDAATSASVERLLRAGAIVHARSAAPEAFIEISCSPFSSTTFIPSPHSTNSGVS